MRKKISLGLLAGLLLLTSCNSIQPSITITQSPSNTITSTSTSVPTSTPTSVPTSVPTSTPTSTPTSNPTSTPTSVPTSTPTSTPTTSMTQSSIPSTGPVVLTNTSLFCVGDSTMSSFSDSYYLPRYGYGTQLSNYFNEKVNVVNLALSGRSSKSFLIENNYTSLKNNLSEGDYLLIGFGHNDEKYDDATRFTDASKPTTDSTSFKYSLYENYIKLALEKGATPILATPIVRANASDDYSGSSAHIVSGYGDYSQAIKDLGTEVDVDVVDLTEITKTQYKSLGYNEAMYYHAFTAGKYDTDGVTIIPNVNSIDTTHLNKYGAKYVAYSFANTIKASANSLGLYVLDNIQAPTKDVDYLDAINPNYTVPLYKAPDLSTYSPNTSFKTQTADWYGTAFGDTGGDPTGKGFIAKEDTASIFTVGNPNSSGKITSSTEGIAFLFKQVSKDDNFTITCDVEVSQQANTKQAGFGLMLRDDCYLPIKDASIVSNYVAAGMYTTSSNTTEIVYSRENGVLSSGSGSKSSLYATNDTAKLKIERTGQVVVCTVEYNSTTYTKTYTDFDFQAIDNEYMYVGMYATRGTVCEFTNVVYTYTGKSQGA